MELCWSCVPCIQERTNLRTIALLGGTPGSPGHNNNNAEKPASPDNNSQARHLLNVSPNQTQSSPNHDLSSPNHDLSSPNPLSPNPAKRRVTFADTTSTNAVYFSGCHLDGMSMTTGAMCQACTQERSNLPLGSHPDLGSALSGAGLTHNEMVHCRHEPQQFAEFTDSSHVGPPGSPHVGPSGTSHSGLPGNPPTGPDNSNNGLIRQSDCADIGLGSSNIGPLDSTHISPQDSCCGARGSLRVVIPDRACVSHLDMPPECCHIGPPECCHIGPSLQQLIADMLVPCEVMVNNQTGVGRLL